MKLKIELDTDRLEETKIRVDGKLVGRVDHLTLDLGPESVLGHIRQLVAPEQHQTTKFRAAGGTTEVDVT